MALAVLSVLLPLMSRGAAPPPTPAPQRELRGPLAAQVAELDARGLRSWQAGDYRAAAEADRQILQLRKREQGPEHWQTADARWVVVAVERADKAPPADREVFRDILRLQRQVRQLLVQRKYAQAEPLCRQVLEVYRRVLGEEHPLTAGSYDDLSSIHTGQGKYAKAEEVCRQSLAITRAVFGEKHPRTALGSRHLADILLAQNKYAQAEECDRQALAIYRAVFGEAHANTAASYSKLATGQRTQGKYAQAEVGFRKALTIFLQVSGEIHPNTAASYGNLATIQEDQGKYVEAEEGHRKALTLMRKLFGERHPQTATSYNNLANNQSQQGKLAEAEEGFREALAISRAVFAEEHPDTALAYNNLATNQQAQGKYAQAEEGFRKALTIQLGVRGEEHIETAAFYLNLASNQTEQGKYVEAEVNSRQALAISCKVLGEKHPQTANCYANLAQNQRGQRKYAEAEEGFRKALAICREVLGEKHPQTAGSYHNLAVNQYDQKKYPEAEEGSRLALTLCREVLGPKHPQTASCSANLANSQRAQGKYAQAEEDFRQALAIYRETLGDQHPRTAGCYYSLARNQQEQGKYTEAERLASQAARISSRIRLQIAADGLDRVGAEGSKYSLPLLAGMLARNGKPDQAWDCFEQSLGRGIGDDFEARLHRTPAERQRHGQLLGRVRQSEARLEQLTRLSGSAEARQEQRRRLLDDLLCTLDSLGKLNAELAAKYGPVAGQALRVAEQQKALPDDGAFLAWLDLEGNSKAKDPNGEHWAVLLKARGGPHWIRLKGSGVRDGWTRKDSELPFRLHEALASPRGDWRELAERLRRQRLGPLAEQLVGVRSLVVLPSVALDGLPIEVLAEGRTVSYSPSASLFAHLRQQPHPKTERGLVLADPTLESSPAPVQQLPPGGLLVRLVHPGSNAQKARLQTGDVLLKYAGQEISDAEQLGRLQAEASGKEKVELTVWREGRTGVRSVPAGPLGVVLDRQPARQALQRQFQASRQLAKARGEEEDWAPLPGTRLEAESLHRLLGEKRVTLLTDSDASEQKLDELARAGRLKEYRYLHLATHGLPDRWTHLQSALILARDNLPDPDRQLRAGLPMYDGRLTAEEVLRGWELDSDLVTLSACQSGLGRYEPGEGHLGFAQAFLLAGSRSVLVSLWKVDDTATALLMDRFYQNLLGRRAKLKEPLSKAEALAEAKSWLRGLSRKEASKRGAELLNGVERGKGKPKLPLAPELPQAPAGVREEDDRPYAHTYYWAAFVLVGRPD
jgi:tetratricopeptide (TPR) repeat protein